MLGAPATAPAPSATAAAEPSSTAHPNFSPEPFAWEDNSDEIESLSSAGGRAGVRNRASSLDGTDIATDLLGSTEVEPYPDFLVNSVPDDLERNAGKLQPVMHGRPPGCAPDAIKLFVGNIPKSCTESQLLPFFETIGKVVDLVVVRDRVTRESKGSAFVWYATRAHAEQAILQLNMRYILPDPTGKQTRPLAIRKAQANPRAGPTTAATKLQGPGAGNSGRASGNSNGIGGAGGGLRSNLGAALVDPLLPGFAASAAMRLGAGAGGGGGGGARQPDLSSLLWPSGAASEAFSSSHAAQAASRVAGLSGSGLNASSGLAQLSGAHGLQAQHLHDFGSALDQLAGAGLQHAQHPHMGLQQQHQQHQQQHQHQHPGMQQQQQQHQQHPGMPQHQQHHHSGLQQQHHQQQQQMGMGMLGGGGSLDGLPRMPLPADMGNGGGMSLSSLMQALGLDHQAALGQLPPQVHGAPPGASLASGLGPDMHGGHNLPSDLFGSVGSGAGGMRTSMGSVGAAGGSGGGMSDWQGYGGGGAAAVAAAAAAAGNLVSETTEPVTLTLALSRPQLLAVTDHLHGIKSLSGAHLVVTPAAAPGVFELMVRGKKSQQQHHQQQQQMGMGMLGGGGSLDGLPRMPLPADMGNGGGMSLSSLMQALGLDHQAALGQLPPQVHGAPPGASLASGLGPDMHGGHNLPSDLFGSVGSGAGGMRTSMGSVGAAGGSGGGMSDWQGYGGGGAAAVAAAAAAAGNLVSETTEPVTLTLALSRPQLLAVTDHLHGIKSLSGAHLVVTPAAAPGVFELMVRGKKSQVNTARVMLHGVSVRA